MRKSLIYILFSCFAVISYGQLEEPFDTLRKDQEDVQDFADVEPKFPGGPSALMEFVQNNIVYPQDAKEAGFEGVVYIQFVITKEGFVRDPKVVRGVWGSIDQEAINLVNKMPRWEPGLQNGVPVNVRYTLPIHFRLH